MPQVEVAIGGRTYRIACADGEEGRIADLAAYFHTKVETLGGPNSAVSEAQILLLAGLLVADELSDHMDAYEEVVAERDRLAAELARMQGEIAVRVQGVEARSAQNIERAAGRLETIVGRLDPSRA